MKRLSVLTVAICVLWAGAAAAQTSRILVSNAGQAAPTEEEPELIGDLENPGAASFQSGLGVISGWVCEAEAVEIELNGARQVAGYGTERLDTESACGDTDNGFGLLVNWNRLEDGEHEIVALVDGVELGRTTVTVTTLGEEFVRGVAGECVAEDFPLVGETVTLAWQETQQNFVIVSGRAPSGENRAGVPGVGYLENPGPASFQSGIGVISGWVCAADEVEIELGDRGRQVAAYGTERLDTREVCGDVDNGFGLLFNWNLLGDGEHAVVAYVDDEELGRATVRVTTLGEEFLRGVEGECVVEDFPDIRHTVTLEWHQTSQNFVMTAVEYTPEADTPTGDDTRPPQAAERGVTEGGGTSSGGRRSSGGGRAPSSSSPSTPRSRSEPAGEDLPADTSTTGRLVVGSPATGRFHEPWDTDWFAVDLERGSRYTFAIRGGDTNPTDALVLTSLNDERGYRVASTYSTEERSSFAFTAHRTGRFYLEAVSEGIRVAYGTATGIGSYVLTLTAEAVSLPPPPPPPEDDYGSQMDATTPLLPVGGSVTGETDYVDDPVYGYDQDVFAVALVANTTYRIDLERTRGGLWLVDLEGIHDAAGTVLADTKGPIYWLTDMWIRRQWFTAATTGQYYLAVVGRGNGMRVVDDQYYTNVIDEERRYRLSIVAMEPPDDYPTAGQVSVGGTVTGQLEWPGDEDRFGIEMEAGTTYRIQVDKQGGKGRPHLAGVYATGVGNAEVHVSSTERSDGKRGEKYYYVTPTVSGTYEVAVSNEEGGGEGAYELTVTTFAGEVEDLPATTSTPKAVTVDGPPQEGRIRPLEDVDWWEVAFTAGQTYRLDAHWKNGRSWGPDLHGIHTAQGDLIAGTPRQDYYVRAWSHVRQWFTATTTGTHYIAVGALRVLSDAEGGDYELAVKAMAPSDDYPAETPGQVSVGGSVTGRLEWPGDEDRFTVDLAAATIYRIDLTTAGGANVALAGVYDAEGRLLPNTTDSDSGAELEARVYFTPTAAGTYAIAARSESGEGGYKLAVTVTDKADDFAEDTGTQGVVEVGGSVTGEIEAPDDEDWFAVTLTGGVSYRIDVEGRDTGQGTLTYLYLEGIYTADGRLIGYSQDFVGSGVGRNARKDFTPGTTGTYYLGVTAATDRTGTYRVSVTEQ